MTAEHLYDQEVSEMQATEQSPTHSFANYSEEWSEKDMQDATRYSLQCNSDLSTTR